MIEDRGYSVGAISPMNVANRLLKPKFFIPDPWTNTKSDNTWISKFVHKATHQLVNDNASGKMKLTNILRIMSVSFVLLTFSDIFKIFLYFLKAISGK